MSRTGYRGGCWPSKEQELLLRAALLKGPQSIHAWEQWKSSVNINEIDQGSYRLLPLLYCSLHSQGIEHPLMKRLKGLHRYTWYKNQILLKEMCRLLRSFEEAGIKTLILKGAALTVLFYKDYGLRPMEDFDVLVPTEQAYSAINLLTELGWKPKFMAAEKLTERYRSFWHAHPFYGAQGGNLDLHWHVFFSSLERRADDDFWDAAIAARIHDVSTLALNAADQLLHVCAHGASWNPVPPLRWVADAMMILDSKAEIDWERLAEQSRKRHLVLPIRDTLGYLREKFGARIPDEVLATLQKFRVSSGERMEYKARSCPENLRGPFLELWLQYMQHKRGMGDASALRRIWSFPGFLRLSWRLDHSWQMPFYIASRGLRRIWNIAGWYKSHEATALSQK